MQDEREITVKYLGENLALKLKGEKIASDIIKVIEKELELKTKGNN